MKFLGEGELSWFRGERISDRYGTVFLTDPNGKSVPFEAGQGQIGSLIAEVVETRTSGHIGDIFRGISPSTPNHGEMICLGTGRLFFEREEEGGQYFYLVGLEPVGIPKRQSDWLDPKALYRAHEQTVKLWFEPSVSTGRA